MEQLIGIDPTLFLGKYWSTFSSSISDVYVISVVVCFVVSILTIGYTSKSRDVNNCVVQKGSKSGKKKNTDDKIRQDGTFEICPDDEVTFQSLLSPEEILEEKSKQAQTKYQPLDIKSPTKHIEEFLRRHRDENVSDSDDEDTLSEEEDEIGSAGSLMGRVKLARQEALRKKLEAEMSEKDKLKEKMIQQQQLARIYSLLTQNQDSFGNVTFDDVQRQMNMYTPP